VLKNNGFHNRHSPFSRPFSPASFFANGEQGWWYDPSNFATLFQDSAGTTPVTAVEQPVGLQLDLSKGLVLGPELVTNGDFSNGSTGWTLGTDWVVSGGFASRGSNATASNLTGGSGVEVGKTYRVTWTQGAETIAVYLGSVAGPLISNSSTPGTFTRIVTATVVGGITIRANNAVSLVDNISIKELPGNHRFQTTSANRPVVSARVNLLTKTEDLTNAAWGSNVTVTVSSGVTDPLGGVTAFSVTANGANSRLGQIVAFAGAMTQNFWVRRRTGTGVINYFNGLAYVALTGVTNDWQQLSVITSPSAPSNYFILQLVTSGDAVDVWRPDLRPTNQGVGLPAYQRVNTSTDYDSTGFPIYIKPNGSNQFMVTNSINFSSTNKMTVWQGVRRLTEASYPMVAELSTAWDTTNGTFAVSGGDPSGEWRFGVRGAGNNIVYYDPGTYTVPITNVLSMQADLAGATKELTVIPRINGVVDQEGGAGTTTNGLNFANLPAYFYMRAGTQLPFNGHDYGSIARGAASTAAQITAGETYINSKTKAY